MNCAIYKENIYNKLCGKIVSIIVRLGKSAIGAF